MHVISKKFMTEAAVAILNKDPRGVELAEQALAKLAAERELVATEKPAEVQHG